MINQADLQAKLEAQADENLAKRALVATLMAKRSKAKAAKEPSVKEEK